MRPTLTSNFSLGYFGGSEMRPPSGQSETRPLQLFLGLCRWGAYLVFLEGSHFDLGFVAGILLEKGLTSNCLEGFICKDCFERCLTLDLFGFTSNLFVECNLGLFLGGTLGPLSDYVYIFCAEKLLRILEIHLFL